MYDVCTRRGAFRSALALAAWPLFADEPKPVKPSYNTMSDEDEISLGRDLSKEMEKREKMKFIESRSLHTYADGILQKVAETSRRPNIPYSLKIVDTTAVNACALPGGFVYLNRGLMEWSHNEAEMVSVLAHEIGHVAGHHGANNICREKSADSLISEASRILLGDEAPGKIIEQLGGPVAVLAMLRYDRYQESEADLLGCYNMQRAGWNPESMVTLFKRLSDRAGGFDSILVVTSDHPASSERAERISEELKQYPPPGKLVTSNAAFDSMQAELKKLPPAPKPSQLSAEG